MRRAEICHTPRRHPQRPTNCSQANYTHVSMSIKHFYNQLNGIYQLNCTEIFFLKIMSLTIFFNEYHAIN